MQSLQIFLYIFVLCAEDLTTFDSTVAILSVRNTKLYKICELLTAMFSTFDNISFEMLLIAY